MLNILLSLTAISVLELRVSVVGCWIAGPWYTYHSSGSSLSSILCASLALSELDIDFLDQIDVAVILSSAIERKSWLSDFRTMATKRMNVLVYSGKELK